MYYVIYDINKYFLTKVKIIQSNLVLHQVHLCYKSFKE